MKNEKAPPVGSRAVVLIRPEDMSVHAGAATTAGMDSLAGTVRDISYHGDSYKLDVAVGKHALKVRLARVSGNGVELGQRVVVAWRPDAARLLPAEDSSLGADGPQP